MQKIVDSINDSVNRTLGVTPNSINFYNQKNIYFKQRKENKIYEKKLRRKKPKFKVGDYVTTLKKDSTFRRGYAESHTKEFFYIVKHYLTTPPTYSIADLKDRVLDKKFYENQLTRVFYDKDNDDMVWEMKVLKVDKKRKKALIHYLVEPKDVHHWVPLSSITKDSL